MPRLRSLAPRELLKMLLLRTQELSGWISTPTIIVLLSASGKSFEGSALVDGHRTGAMGIVVCCSRVVDGGTDRCEPVSSRRLGMRHIGRGRERRERCCDGVWGRRAVRRRSRGDTGRCSLRHGARSFRGVTERVRVLVGPGDPGLSCRRNGELRREQEQQRASRRTQAATNRTMVRQRMNKRA